MTDSNSEVHVPEQDLESAKSGGYKEVVEVTIEKLKEEVPVKSKRKRKREDKIERTVGVVEKLTLAMQDSDDKILQLEEKRMKFEEKLIEMEYQRVREKEEREERQRKEDRDFQMRLFSMLMQQQGSPSFTQPYYYNTE